LGKASSRNRQATYQRLLSVRGSIGTALDALSNGDVEQAMRILEGAYDHAHRPLNPRSPRRPLRPSRSCRR
jgi:hypothetical protein